MFTIQNFDTYSFSTGNRLKTGEESASLGWLAWIRKVAHYNAVVDRVEVELENVVYFCRYTVRRKGETICSNIDFNRLRTCLRSKCEDGGVSESRSTHISCKCNNERQNCQK